MKVRIPMRAFYGISNYSQHILNAINGVKDKG